MAQALLVLLFCTCAVSLPAYPQVPEVIAAGASLTGLVSGLKGLAKQIEDSGHRLLSMATPHSGSSKY